MSRLPRLDHLLDFGFPRVSGDEPSRMCFFEWSAEFSPRERG